MQGIRRPQAALALGILALAGCSIATLGATPDKLALAQSQAAPGAALFGRECAPCHGQRGEGVGSNPPVMGPSALPIYPRASSAPSDPTMAQQQQQQVQVTGQASRQNFKTAADVFEYVSTRMPMPKSRAGTLKPEDYWAIVNFMLTAHGVSVPPGGITAGNAQSVAMPGSL
jgi:mono/diheme cytochrome c family protein